jgi:mono/diheme cytochrome c family protein
MNLAEKAARRVDLIADGTVHKRSHPRIGTMALLSVLCVSGLAIAPGCTAEQDEGVAEDDLTNSKQAAYLRANADGLRHFRDIPVGNTGIPLVLLKLFPDVAPAQFSANWANEVGFLPSSSDEFFARKDTQGLPYGFGWTTNTGLRVAVPSCASCHTGAVEVNGKLRYVLGAPNTRLNLATLRKKVLAVMQNPSITIDTFKNALKGKKAGWLYPNNWPQEAIESAAIGKAYDMFRERVLGVQARQVAGPLAHAYKGDEDLLTDGIPGQTDIFAIGGTNLAPAALFEPGRAQDLSRFLATSTSFSDFPSVWNANTKARPDGQWDGFITEQIARNTAGAVGFLGLPSAVDFGNVVAVTKFVADLPAPAYPFATNPALVAAGRTIYKQACSSCHESGTRFSTLKEIGTDPARAQGLTPGIAGVLRKAIEDACKDKWRPECSQASVEKHVLNGPGGYIAGPLDGIWARAPYLHNGSVPTLRQVLIAEERPEKFYRGNFSYNVDGVGFEWKSGTALFDTKRRGNGNRGHAGAAFNGKYDFAHDAASTNALLAYLKTL